MNPGLHPGLSTSASYHNHILAQWLSLNVASHQDEPTGVCGSIFKAIKPASTLIFSAVISEPAHWCCDSPVDGFPASKPWALLPAHVEFPLLWPLFPNPVSHYCEFGSLDPSTRGFCVARSVRSLCHSNNLQEAKGPLYILAPFTASPVVKYSHLSLLPSAPMEEKWMDRHLTF